MRVVSVNVGTPVEVEWRGRTVSTSIFKQPVDRRVTIATLGLLGDRQADPRVHGGADKAVYAYPVEHYAYWRQELGRELPFGTFGENLTVEGMPLEAKIAIGDSYRVGTAELEVTQPRLPCFKLGIRFGDAGMVKRFLRAGRTGFYLRVLREGHVEVGEAIEPLTRDPAAVPVSEVTRLYAEQRDDLDAMRRVLGAAALPDDWRSHFERRLVATPGLNQA